jgi:sec-independent protein translocase protein TatA
MNTALFAVVTGTEIIMICVAIVFLFGARKVPELMKGLGQGIKEFKKASQDGTDKPE